MLAGLDVKVIFILDDGCVGFICFPHWKSSKITLPSAVFEASLHTKLLKKRGKGRVYFFLLRNSIMAAMAMMDVIML